MHTAATTYPCPRDGHLLTSIHDDGMNMGSCGSCGGLWVPMAQLAPRLSNRVTSLLFQDKDGRDTLLRCPIDGAAMREIDVGGVHIDRCNSCRGLWFDAGELTTVLGLPAATSTKASPDQWKDTVVTAVDAVGNGAVELVTYEASDSIFHGVGDVVSTIAEFLGDALSL